MFSKIVAWASIAIMFGAVLYVRVLAARRGVKGFSRNFAESVRFYRDNWRELRVPLLVAALAAAALISAVSGLR